MLMIDAAGSPLTRDDQPCKPDDLLLAAKICAAKIGKRNGGFVPLVTIRATIRDQWRLALATVNRKRIRREFDAWMAYMGDYLDTPGLMETPGKQPRPLSSPGVFAAAVAGAKLFGEERAWSMPFGLLKTCLQVYAEINGGEIRFEPSEEEKQRIAEEQKLADEAGAEILRKIEAGEIVLR